MSGFKDYSWVADVADQREAKFVTRLLKKRGIVAVLYDEKSVQKMGYKNPAYQALAGLTQVGVPSGQKEMALQILKEFNESKRQVSNEDYKKFWSSPSGVVLILFMAAVIVFLFIFFNSLAQR